MAKVMIYIEDGGGAQSAHWVLSEYNSTLFALQQVEALFTLLANPWYGNPDLDAVRASVQAMKTSKHRKPVKNGESQ